MRKGACGWPYMADGPSGAIRPGVSLLETVRLPCANVTQLAFGGEDLRTAFVTTARNGLTPDQAALQPWRE